MNLKDINCFIMICQKKSITAASEFLYISPQALSKTIQKMETELGAELLKRSKRGVELTVYGKVFYKGAIKILDEYEDTSSKIKSLTMQNKGIISMASAFGILRYLTPEYVNSFAKAHPNIHLDYMEFPDQNTVENIKEGKYDIGLTPYITKDNELEYIDLFSSEIFFITHAGSAFYDREVVSIREIIQEPLIIENKNFIIHDILLEICKNEHVQPNLYFNTSGFSLCYKLCYKGEGNTISMSFMYDDMKYDSLRMIPFKEHPMWKVAMIYKKDSVLSKNIKELISYTLEWCQ